LEPKDEQPEAGARTPVAFHPKAWFRETQCRQVFWLALADSFPSAAANSGNVFQQSCRNFKTFLKSHARN
jgi:hypothetical protein